MSENRTILLQTTTNRRWQPFPVSGNSSGCRRPRYMQRGRQGSAAFLLQAGSVQSSSTSGWISRKWSAILGWGTRKTSWVHPVCFPSRYGKAFALYSGSLFCLVCEVPHGGSFSRLKKKKIGIQQYLFKVYLVIRIIKKQS